MKLIMREEKATAGQVIVNNFKLNELKRRQIPKMRRTMGIVFQDFRLIPKMSVYDNVAFAMRVIGKSEREIRKRVPYILNLVNLGAKARSFPNELSGGEQQRVSLARALVNNPGLIVADEPTGNVDPEMSFEIVNLLSQINEKGTTILMVTHEHDLVRQFDRRVVVIEGGTIVSDTKENPAEIKDYLIEDYGANTRKASQDSVERATDFDFSELDLSKYSQYIQPDDESTGGSHEN